MQGCMEFKDILQVSCLFFINKLLYDREKPYNEGQQYINERKQINMEFWDIYDKDKKPTGRTMKRNDW